MNVYAVSDLHMSSTTNKPMDIFGSGWEGHIDKIFDSWNSLVTDEDIVLIAGDISWAMKMNEALFDLNRLKGLKGKKVFCRGNHDYWWNGFTRLRAQAPDESFVFLQNDCVKIQNVVIAGSRGWTCPGSADYTAQDFKLYQREGERFRLAFQEVDKVRKEGDSLIVIMHYPPFNLNKAPNLFTACFEENKADKVVFGHIHGAVYFPLVTEINGISYYLTSCDKLNFRLIKIL